MLREALTRDRLDQMASDEAAAWFAAYRNGGLSAHEEVLLADWLAADPEHDRAYRHAGRALDAFVNADGDEIVEAMRAHATAPRAARAIWPRAAAAAVVLVVAASLLALVGRGLMPAGGETVRYIAQREVRDITLPDGSTMTLDAQSVALARFDDEERSLELERGRALFSVRHDLSRPFAVDAGSRRVIALGTEFEVDRAPSRLTVSLFKGRVAIEPVANGATVTLAPGERFVEANGQAVVQRFATGIAPGGWREGLLEFDDRPLADAVAEANRYSAEQLVVRDPAVGAMRISGQFRAGDAERFARTLAEIYPLRVVRREGEIELAPAR